MLHFLFSFQGRVNRAKFWLYYLGSSFVLSAGVMALMLLDVAVAKTPAQSNLLEAIRLHWPQTQAGDAIVIATVAFLVAFFYSFLSMIVRRLHDRGKSAWWLVFFNGAPLVFFGAAFFLGWPPHNNFPGQPIMMGLAVFACWLISVWYMVELLFLSGTRGANRFGPDPRAKRIDRPQGGA